MEVIWHILLTVCIGSSCMEQDIQWFDTEQQCFEMLSVYKSIPIDGDWDSVEYQCKPVGSTGT